MDYLPETLNKKEKLLIFHDSVKPNKGPVRI